MEKHFWDKSLVFFYTLLSIGQISVSTRFRPVIIWAVFVFCSLNPDITCYILLCLFSHFHGTRYFEGVSMCFATVLLYGSYYMRGIQFILFFPEGSQITSFVRIKLLQKGVLLLNTTHAKQDHSLFELFTLHHQQYLTFDLLQNKP